jgi:DNA-binding NarL/FixJ family response regulator
MDRQMNPPRMNILINLSSRLLNEALKSLLTQDKDTFQAVTIHNPEFARGFEPDKVLVDATTLEQSLPSEWTGANIILIDTGLAEEEVIRLLFSHKLDGVISTGAGTELFKKALRAIQGGQVWIDNRKLKAMLHNRPSSLKPNASESLSRKEREIVLLVAEGQRNREIAGRLCISEQTVKAHLSRIFKKANVSNRSQLVPLALKYKL